MKVLDLACPGLHVFEGWFASEDDYQDQLSRGLIACPVCGDRQVEKRLSTPRLNLRSSGSVAGAPANRAGETAHQSARGDGYLATDAAQALQAAWWKAMRQIAERTEDVGERFATEARRMHHGDIPARDIRGQASPEDAKALLEEGIDLLPLPDLNVFKSPLQ